MQWYTPSDRPMPWKEEENPYLIWLSEIILQQTRVEQGRSYYLKFKENYPTVFDLAKAPEDELMKHWEGLGYYSRARNLHAAAKYIAEDLQGKFPSTYEEILELKGVGPYTAAAIASFAFNLPHAVLDGNVYRVLARFFGVEISSDSTEGKKFFSQLSNEVLDEGQAAKYNQAIMDFGATVCKPKGALCESKCPLREKCFAFKNDKVSHFPVRNKKLKRSTRYFHYLVLNQGNHIFLKKRLEKDIWQNLYDLPLIEVKEPTNWEDLKQSEDFQKKNLSKFYGILSHSPSIKQELTHRTVIAQFHELKVSDDFVPNEKWIRIQRNDTKNYAFPKIIAEYLNKNSLYLNL